MATHDYIINNQTFPSTRTDINSALQAIVSNNSSATEPATKYAYMMWYDTTTDSWKMRNADNDDWIQLATFDQATNTVNFLDSTISSPLSVTGTATAGAEIRLPEDTDNGANYVALKAPDTLASDVTFTLPSADGTTDQVLKTNGSGVLSFADAFTGIAWQSVQTTSFTASAGNGYPCDTTSSSFTVTLPASATAGDSIQLVDYAGTFNTNNLILGRNGLNIEGATSNKSLTTNREAVTCTYVDATQGWVASSGVNSGTQALDPIIYSADFLVIAGGGGGGNGGAAGGGGAGGYRNSFSTESSGGGGSSEASLTFVGGTVYTITVGAGGAGGTAGNPLTSANGVDSSISGTGITTITSTGGGRGGGGASANAGSSGGSGGGASAYGSGTSGSSGTANQGFGGGNSVGSGSNNYGGGGGGVSAVGVNGTSSPANAGNGGAGLASSITGSSVTRAGGGGGGAENGTLGTGGTGGGGNGTSSAGTGGAGSVNTGSGGGGGGGGATVSNGGAGGSGVVILSMPDANYSGTTTGSPTVATGVSGKTVLTFTGSGTYTG
jgi:hypothetical protein